MSVMVASRSSVVGVRLALSLARVDAIATPSANFDVAAKPAALSEDELRHPAAVSTTTRADDALQLATNTSMIQRG